MASKQKYTQDICKLSQSSTRLKEQVAGRLLLYWKEELKGGKTKICAVFTDGQTFQNVLTAEAWADADQAHAEKHLKPLLGQVVALENGKITGKGKTTVFHGKQLKLSYDKSTVVKKLHDKEEYGKALPLLAIADVSKLPSLCAISLLVCVQDVSGPSNRTMPEGGEKPVSNLQVAFEDRKLDAAFWGHKLAKEMGRAKKGDVYRFDWITLVPLGQGLFKLVSNSGTQVEQIHGSSADTVRDAVKDTLVSMSPQFGMSRSEKLKLSASRVSLSFVAHMKEADITTDNSNAYKGTVLVPCCFIKELRSLGDSASGCPYYYGCPQCKKATKIDDTCPDHGKVTPTQVVGAAVVLQDPSATFEATLWKEPLEALRSEFAVGPEVPEADVLPVLAEKTSACQLVARVAVGINKSGTAQYVDLFDLAPAVSTEGVLGAFHDLPALPGEDADGLAPLCCQHLHQDGMGQLQAKIDGHTRLIGGAMCMFRVSADPEQFIVQDVDGLIVKVQAACCVCNKSMTLQQAGAPQTVQKMNRMRVGELALASVILQSDGSQPFEVMQMRAITTDEMQHEKLHKFQAAEYQKFITGSMKLDVTKEPSSDVQNLLQTQREAKRLKIQHTVDAHGI